MKHIYEISKVLTVVTYTNYTLDDAGKKDIATVQTIAHEGLLSGEQLIADAKTKIAPGEVVEVQVAEGVVK